MNFTSSRERSAMLNELAHQRDSNQFSGTDVLNIVQLMSERAPLPEVLTAITRLIEAQGDRMLCAIWLIDEDGHFHNAAAPSVPPEYVAMLNGGAPGPNDCSCGAAVARKEPVYVADIFTDPLWVNYRDVTAGYGLRACWSRPLLSKTGKVLGTFATYYREPRTPNPVDLALIEHACSIVGLAIERQTSEEELRRGAAFLVQAQHLSRTGSFSWRVETDEITWSEQLYRIFDFDPRVPVTLQLIGKRVHPEDFASFTDVLIRAQRGGDFEVEHRLLMPDRSIKYVHVIAHATTDSYDRLEFIGAIQDVTERRRSEEALGQARSELARVARVTSVGALTASIAHEVNQPLSGIITNASTCLRMLAADPPNVEGAVETARRTIRDSQRASDVINRLRALFTRRDFATEPVDLNEVAREVIALTSSELHRGGIVLRSELAADLPPVNGDRIQLQQVILNLLLNASDAMTGIHDRPRRLEIWTAREESDGVRLTVRDAGIGFGPDMAERLFDPFYTTKSDGMGIGLSVSRSIIQRHDGQLRAAPNADGPGATFWFSIPGRVEGVTGATA
jgi:signal transduction histidine kinase